MIVDDFDDTAPSAGITNTQKADRKQSDENNGAMDEVGEGGAPQAAQGGIADEHDGGDHDGEQHVHAGESGEYGADDVGLDDIDDEVFGLDAEAGEGLAAARAVADGEGLADRVQLEAAVGDGEKKADDGHGEKGADGVPPHVPNAAGHHIAGDAVGAGAADAGAGDADGNHGHTHAAACNGPVARGRGLPRQQTADDGHDDKVDDNDDERDIHAAGGPPRRRRLVCGSNEAPIIVTGGISRKDRRGIQESFGGAPA